MLSCDFLEIYETRCAQCQSTLSIASHIFIMCLVIRQHRWDTEGQSKGNPNYRARFGAWVECIEKFDARFFGISKPEATLMDAQQRMLLEVAWEALKVQFI